MSGFRKEDLYRFKEAFNIFDVRQTGSVNKEDLPSLLAILHISPLQSELKDLSGKFSTPDGKVKYRDYINIITNLKHRIDNSRGLTEAFQLLQEEGGDFISVARLKEILTSKGEALTAEEFDKLVTEADPRRSGKINYKDFIKILMA